MKPAEDPSAADWIINQVRGFGKNVGSVVPAGLGSYVRVFHPAMRHEDVDEPLDVSWRDIAAANQKIAHSEMQFEAIVSSECFDGSNWRHGQSGLWDSPPQEGNLDAPLLDHVLEVLSAHTGTPDRCWFGFWNGWGIPVPLSRPDSGTRESDHLGASTYEQFRLSMNAKLDGPAFSLPGRVYVLLEGPLMSVKEGWYEPPLDDDYQSPSLWWPEDHAWFVATEIDFMSTYIAGSDSCTSEILSHPRIEALPATIVHSINKDPLNIAE